MKFSKFLTTAAITGAVTVASVIPAFAGTLAQDQAWVRAQAEAGMKSGQAYLVEIARQAEAGMKSGQAYLTQIEIQTAKDAAWVQAQANQGVVSGQAYLKSIYGK